MAEVDRRLACARARSHPEASRTNDKTAVLSRYGRTPKNDDEIRSYAKAVKIVVGADGQIPAAEAKAMRVGLGRLGASKALYERLTHLSETAVPARAQPLSWPSSSAHVLRI